MGFAGWRRRWWRRWAAERSGGGSWSGWRPGAGASCGGECGPEPGRSPRDPPQPPGWGSRGCRERAGGVRQRRVLCVHPPCRDGQDDEQPETEASSKDGCGERFSLRVVSRRALAEPAGLLEALLLRCLPAFLRFSLPPTPPWCSDQSPTEMRGLTLVSRRTRISFCDPHQCWVLGFGRFCPLLSGCVATAPVAPSRGLRFIPPQLEK